MPARVMSSQSNDRVRDPEDRRPKLPNSVQGRNGTKLNRQAQRVALFDVIPKCIQLLKNQALLNEARTLWTNVRIALDKVR